MKVCMACMGGRRNSEKWSKQLTRKLPVQEKKQMQKFLEKLLMFMFFLAILIYKLLVWFVKGIIWVIAMLWFGLKSGRE